MADKKITELTAATEIGDSDLLVAEQGGSAVSVTASLLKEYTVSDVNTALETILESTGDVEGLAEIAEIVGGDA